MEWTDDAVLLTVAKAGKRNLVLEVLTAEHGRRRCVTSYGGGEQPTLLPGSFLTLKCTGDDLGKPLVAELSRITGGLIAADDEDIGLAALKTVKDLLVALLPLEEPMPEIYEALVELLTSLVQEDGRWPLHYAAWEFALLHDLGQLDGVRRCMTAFRHGELIYVSPRTGAIVTREEGGAFIDKLIPLPGFLLGGKSATLPAVRQGFELTETLMTRFALRGTGHDLPATRVKLTKALAQMENLPPKPKSLAPIENAETRAKRLEAMRPLMVAGALSAR